jgi:hypothetical protein
MRAAISFLVLLTACGGTTSGSAPDWVGSWRSAASVPGSYSEMTLEGRGTSLGGTGVQHVEAGIDRPFVVLGTTAPVPGPGVTFTYADGATEGFTFSQPDATRLVLSNPSRELSFVRPTYQPCAGKACGASCQVCPPADPNCVETAVVKACTVDGTCVPAGYVCPAGPAGPCSPVPACGV